MVLYYSPVQSQPIQVQPIQSQPVQSQPVGYYATSSSGSLTPLLGKVFTPTQSGEYTIPGVNVAVSETTMYAIVGAILGAAAVFS